VRPRTLRALATAGVLGSLVTLVVFSVTMALTNSANPFLFVLLLVLNLSWSALLTLPRS
jgi:F0F1-type ATP synthase assembly protein I